MTSQFSTPLICKAGDTSEVDTTTTDFCNPLRKSFCRNSLTSRPRSPTIAIILTSAEEERASIPINVDLPTPEPAIIAIRLPLPNVNIVSMTRTPVYNGLVINCLFIGFGAAFFNGREWRPMGIGLSSIGLPNGSITRPNRSSPTGIESSPRVNSTLSPNCTSRISSKGMSNVLFARNPTTSHTESLIFAKAPNVAVGASASIKLPNHLNHTTPLTNAMNRTQLLSQLREPKFFINSAHEEDSKSTIHAANMSSISSNVTCILASQIPLVDSSIAPAPTSLDGCTFHPTFSARNCCANSTLLGSTKTVNSSLRRVASWLQIVSELRLPIVTSDVVQCDEAQLVSIQQHPRALLAPTTDETPVQTLRSLEIPFQALSFRLIAQKLSFSLGVSLIVCLPFPLLRHQLAVQQESLPLAQDLVVRRTFQRIDLSV